MPTPADYGAYAARQEGKGKNRLTTADYKKNPALEGQIAARLDKFPPRNTSQRAIGKDGIGDKKGSHLSKSLINRINRDSGKIVKSPSDVGRVLRAKKDIAEGKVRHLKVVDKNPSYPRKSSVSTKRGIGKLGIR